MKILKATNPITNKEYYINRMKPNVAKILVDLFGWKYYKSNMIIKPSKANKITLD